MPGKEARFARNLRGNDGATEDWRRLRGDYELSRCTHHSISILAAPAVLNQLPDGLVTGHHVQQVA